MASIVATSPLCAQVLPPGVPPPIFDPTGRSGEPPTPLKKEFKPPAPPPRPALPSVPMPPDSDVKKQIGQVRVFVTYIHVAGSTVFSDAELDAVTKPYVNRTLTTEDLERVRLALTLLYVNKGYITSGAVIPDQDVTLGVIKIQIIEGTLAQINVEGTDWFRASYVQDRVAMGVQTPLTLAPLQERLQLLQQDRRIERVNAELRPGEAQGQSVLNLRVAERNPFRASLDFNNYTTPLVGELRGLATVGHDNLTGHGDVFRFTYGRSEGTNPLIDTSYALPLNRYDTTFTAFYRRADYLLVEKPIDALNLKTNTEVIGMTLSQPVYRTIADEVTLSITGEHLFMQTFISNDIPFAIFPGTAPNGVATVSALRFAQEWTHRTLDTIVAARSRFSVGLNVLGATITPDANNPGPDDPSGQFFSWLGQAQAVKQFGDNLWGMQALGRMDLQLANSPLFPLEQVVIGGRYSVRGYREVTLLADNAFLASLETRFPLVRWANGIPMIQFAPFADVGHGWSLGVNKNFFTNTGLPHTLASVGAGLRWNIFPKEWAAFEVYWGHQLNHLNRVADSAQDYGIHFGLTITVL
jgi:hemolysin activation/secretion protein